MSSFAAASADGSAKAIGKQRHMPWVEKYRPERVEDVSHQDEVVKTLKYAIDQGSVPHLLFYGPPGTGISIYNPDLLCFDALTISCQAKPPLYLLWPEPCTARTCINRAS